MGSKLPKSEAIKVAQAIEVVRAYRDKFPLVGFKPYPWQQDFYAAGAQYPHRMLCAANRIGKTLAAGVEIAYHATGEYPDWWVGRRFEHAPLIWALGVSGEQIRDVIQLLLFGFYDGKEFAGGLIRRDQIKQVVPATGTARLAKDVRVFHREGVSTISQKSYSQGQNPLMGANVDAAWIDEEPQDPTIYPQVVTRTTLGDKGRGGLLIITETPELGMTELLRTFMEDRAPSQYFANVTWDDAPHLSDAVKADILAAIPEYQREMRSKGIPVLGEGRVFPIAEERILVDPFPVPAHWFRCAAIDFGIDHPTACVWVAEDRDTDTVYVTDTYRQAGEVPVVHAAAINRRDSCPIIYPHDGDNTEKGSGQTLAELYAEAGLELHVRFTNPDGSRYVEPGILDLSTRMREGRLKVFRTCTDWLQEFRLYHRKGGKIVKLDDDLMDATRYAVMSVGRYGEQGAGLNPLNSLSWDDPIPYGLR